MNNNTIKHFESFLEKRNNLLDNLAYQLLWLLTQPGTEQTEAVLSEFPWDMSLIGPLLETAESLLQKAGFSTCYPFYGENEIPCIHADQCQHPVCPLLITDSTTLSKETIDKQNGGQKE